MLSTLFVEDYAKLENFGSVKVIKVRGTAYPTYGDADYSSNFFYSHQARELAAYINKLADEAEKPTEPVYQAGEVYVGRNGYKYLRTNKSKWLVMLSDGWTYEYDHDAPPRPLVKLIREDA